MGRRQKDKQWFTGALVRFYDFRYDKAMSEISGQTSFEGEKAGGFNLATLRRSLSEQMLAYISVALVLFLGSLTFVLLSSEAFLSQRSNVAGLLLVVDIIVLAMLLIFVGRQIFRLFSDRRRRLAGYQLHWRLVTLFGGITVFPTIIVVAFSFFVLDVSLRGWFSERISTAINDSVTVANAYLEEHIQSVEGQILAMANDINREAGSLSGNQRRFNAYLTNQAGVRSLSEAVVIDSTGRVVASSRFAYAVTFSSLDDEFFNTARNGEVAIINVDSTNRIRAGVRLNQFVDAYLLVGRFIDPTVSTAVAQTQTAASEYQVLDIRQIDLKVSFAAFFGMVALLLLLCVIWVGLNFATAIAESLGSVILVAEQVRSGNLASRVAMPANNDEIARLGLSFNRMLDDINKNREELVEANRQLDKRREFTEAVLAGVSSGVIGIDKDKSITLPNLAALEMLGLSKMNAIGKKLDTLVPEFSSLLESAGKPTQKIKQQNIEIKRKDNTLNLLARLTTETVNKRIVGYVVTFENVSELLDAQRKAAWSDVARRIAHEIKNPLTPIQLAAERLRAKYMPNDAKGKASFDGYIETISRQVDDIGRLVNEFSAFARMPAPQMEKHDLVEMLKGQINLFEAGHKVTFIFANNGSKTLEFVCDDGMIRQVITNLLQNAVDAMADAQESDRRVLIELGKSKNSVSISITDNGPGLPQQDGVDLTEPYVTFRKKGTGLGLAIVRRIVEDHSGSLMLGASVHPDYKGASVNIMLRHSKTDKKEAFPQ